MTVPKEDEEAQCLAKRLNLHGYKFSHIGNESGQGGSRNIIAMMAKKKRMGVSKGFPDYCIILKNGSLLFIELKRQRKILKSGKVGASPSVVSDEQKERIKCLGSIYNVYAHIAYGRENAVSIIGIL